MSSDELKKDCIVTLLDDGQIDLNIDILTPEQRIKYYFYNQVLRSEGKENAMLETFGKHPPYRIYCKVQKVVFINEKGEEVEV